MVLPSADCSICLGQVVHDLVGVRRVGDQAAHDACATSSSFSETMKDGSMFWMSPYRRIRRSLLVPVAGATVAATAPAVGAVAADAVVGAGAEGPGRQVGAAERNQRGSTQRWLSLRQRP